MGGACGIAAGLCCSRSSCFSFSLAAITVPPAIAFTALFVTVHKYTSSELVCQNISKVRTEGVRNLAVGYVSMSHCPQVLFETHYFFMA